MYNLGKWDYIYISYYLETFWLYTQNTRKLIEKLFECIGNSVNFFNTRQILSKEAYLKS